MEPQIKYVTAPDSVSIAYWSMGDGGLPLMMGSPLIFGHLVLEWEFVPLRNWYLHLAERRTVIRFDPRNEGLSQRGVPAERVGLDDAISDIQALADKLELSRFALFAAGGGAIAPIALAHRAPERIARLIIDGGFDRFANIWDLPGMREVLALAEKNWDLFTETMTQALFGWGRPEGHDWARFIRASVSQEDFHTSRWLEMDVSALLSSVFAPALLLHRKRLPLVNSNSQRLASAMPNARLYQCEDILFTDEGAQAVIDAFLAEGDEPAFASAFASSPPGTAIILFADIVDSTALTERMGDVAFRERARALDTSMRGIIAAAGGTTIDAKTLGDGVLATFPAASQAIDAALRCAAAGEEHSLPLHLGIHAGDVIREQNNVFGGAVNIASRICGLSAPGEILVSDVVRGMARSSAGVDFEDRGEQDMKGVGEPVRVYAVRAAE